MTDKPEIPMRTSCGSDCMPRDWGCIKCHHLNVATSNDNIPKFCGECGTKDPKAERRQGLFSGRVILPM